MKQISGNSVSCCPTSCPYLGKNGCKVACGNEEIEFPVMAGVMKAKDRVQGVIFNPIKTPGPKMKPGKSRR